VSSIVILAGLALAVLACLASLAHRATISRRAMQAHRAQAMRWRVWLRLRPGPGFASLAELWLRWSRQAAIVTGRRGRPGLRLWRRIKAPTTDYAVRLGRAQLGRRVYARMQDQVLILAPQQVGKSGMLADRIIDHPGAVLSTSTRADLFTNTAGLRARRGPIAVFNPLGVGGVPSTFGWNVIDGCADPATASRRAEDLTGALATGSDLAFWQGKASTALAALLHAAALTPGGATIIDVHGWVHRQGDKMAEDVLTSHPGASRAMRAVLAEIRESGKSADSVRLTISRCLTWVAVPAVAAAVTPPPGSGFDVAAFVRDRGSLYMIAPGTENSPIAPLFRAFCQHVHHEAGLAGSKTRAGKVDPPLLLALDELTQICPLPLPEILSDSAGKGVLVAAVVHGVGQLEARWGHHGASAIWATCGTKILLGGISDADTLEHVSRLCGDVAVLAHSETRDDQGRRTETRSYAQARVLPPELLRTLPSWRALVLRMNLRPVIVKVRPVWKRNSHRFGRAVPVPVLRAAPAPLQVRQPVAAPEDRVQARNGSNGHHA
jgi:type IV secretion system protein VirD4